MNFQQLSGLPEKLLTASSKSSLWMGKVRFSYTAKEGFRCRRRPNHVLWFSRFCSASAFCPRRRRTSPCFAATCNIRASTAGLEFRRSLRSSGSSLRMDKLYLRPQSPTAPPMSAAPTATSTPWTWRPGRRNGSSPLMCESPRRRLSTTERCTSKATTATCMR